MEIGEIVTKTRPSLDTVRALHQTIVALRAALEQSKSEITELKAKSWPVDSVEDALRTLSIENHVLRSQLVDNKTNENKSKELVLTSDKNEDSDDNKKNELLIKNELNKETISKSDDLAINQPPVIVEEANNILINKEKVGRKTKNANKVISSISNKPVKKASKKLRTKLETKIVIKSTHQNQLLPSQKSKVSTSLESLTIVKTPNTESNKLKISKTFTLSNLSTSLVTKEFSYSLNPDNNKSVEMSGNNLNENNSTKHQTTNSQQNDLEQDQEVDDIELIFTTDETKDSDFKEQLVSIDAGESITNNTTSGNLLQCPVSDLEQNIDLSDRELDDDVFNDNFENENQENSNFQSFDFKRENSQLYNSKSDNSLNREENKSLKSCYSYQDSSFENKSLEKDESFDRFEERIRIVETDISKCGIQDVEYVANRRNTCPNPLQYRPLLHREALSKGLNARKPRPILAHSNAIRKDSGAQTDISALPGSAWLSESSLANKVRLGENFPTLPSKFPLPGSRLRLSEKTVEARRVLLSDIGFTSMVPELSRSADHLCPANMNKPPVVTTYGQFLKTSDFTSPAYTSQRFTWMTATPSECSYSQSRYNSMYPLPSPPAQSRRCSAPVSPSRRCILKSAPSKVRFANGSLPELRGDWTLTLDSGDSTDSLVEEAENYLRRSIDCLMTSRERTINSEGKRTVPRRASAPEPSGDNVPPQGWQPFLPRVPRDLKPDHWVKVITPEGRVKGGRVRYVGPVISQSDQFVGVQLGNPDGHSDGTFSNRRYFQCEPYHGIFVPFKKVIMGWRP